MNLVACYIRHTVAGDGIHVWRDSPSNLQALGNWPEMSSQLGKYKTVQARFWPWPSGEIPQTLLSCSNFARKRIERAIAPRMFYTTGVPRSSETAPPPRNRSVNPTQAELEPRQALRGGIQTSILTNVGDSLQMLTKTSTNTGYPHEGPFVVLRTQAVRGCHQPSKGGGQIVFRNASICTWRSPESGT